MTDSTSSFSDQSIALIEEHIRHLITVMGFDEATVHCSCKEEKGPDDELIRHLRIAITAGEAGRVLIGAHGTHLHALQHIARSLIKRQIKEPLRITLDINGYLASRERALLHLAEEAARKVGRTGQAITLPPMAAAQRRTIHTTLAARQDVNTASSGEEPNRRVIVRPVFI